MPINLSSLQTVMLVDDDAATNFIHEQFIREAGFSGTIQAFQRADEAAEHLAMHRPQILFLDLNMPGMDGWEFLDALEQRSELARPDALVVLTTSLNPDHHERAKAHPLVNTVLNKPLTSEGLAQALIPINQSHA